MRPSHSHTNAANTITSSTTRQKTTSSTQTRITGQRFYSPEKLPAFHTNTAAGVGGPRASASHSNVANNSNNTTAATAVVAQSMQTRVNSAEKRSNSVASRDSAGTNASRRGRTATHVAHSSASSTTSSMSRVAAGVDSKSTQTQGRMVKLSDLNAGAGAGLNGSPCSVLPPTVPRSIAAQSSAQQQQQQSAQPPPLPTSLMPSELIEELSIKLRHGSVPSQQRALMATAQSPFSRAVPEHSTTCNFLCLS